MKEEQVNGILEEVIKKTKKGLSNHYYNTKTKPVGVVNGIWDYHVVEFVSQREK
jgi:hypothetical protein